jgi:endonuclease/exonuclease/phosphatase (EEP) superfamily protein YafD
LTAVILVAIGIAPLVTRAFEFDRGSFLLSGAVGVRPLATIALIVAIPFAMKARASWLTLLSVVGIALSLYWSMPVLTRPGPVAAPAGTDVSVMSINLLYTSSDLEPVAEALTAETPDILLLLELTNSHMADLEAPLAELYQYNSLAPADDVSGIGLWSKHPIDSSSIAVMANGGWPSIRSEIDLGAHSIRLIGIHPPPPGNTTDRGIQRAELSSVARLPQDMPTIVMGDFNASSEHAVMRDFLASTTLQDAHEIAGPLYSGTWPTNLPGPTLLHIDHILASGDFVVEEATIPSFEWGGDHRPVAARLTIPHS